MYHQSSARVPKTKWTTESDVDKDWQLHYPDVQMLTQSLISENKNAAARRGENQYTNHPKTFILQRIEVTQTGEEASVEYEKD